MSKEDTGPTLLERTNAETSAKLHTKVGLAAHPDSLLPLGSTLCDDAGPGQVAYAAGRRALATLYESESAAHDAIDAVSEPVQKGIRGSDSRTLQNEVPPTRRAELRSAIGSASSRALQSHALATKTVEDAVAKLNASVESALADPKASAPANVSQAADIRRYVAALAPAERMNFLQKTIKDGDAEVSWAVLSATCYLSGLDKAQHKLLHDLAAAHFAKRDFEQLTAARKVLDAVNAAGERYVGSIGKINPKVEENPREVALARLRGV